MSYSDMPSDYDAGTPEPPDLPPRRRLGRRERANVGTVLGGGVYLVVKLVTIGVDYYQGTLCPG